ncbi:hypothetical protein [Actinokineospora inagensis]|uniref:hypothetical protein n=1 Tax=Actinokineospora inagensis TaxID=103730 RepID=UPI00040D02A6|nr:hypothetical protein [Actinokineospora inagensis]
MVIKPTLVALLLLLTACAHPVPFATAPPRAHEPDQIGCLTTPVTSSPTTSTTAAAPLSLRTAPTLGVSLQGSPAVWTEIQRELATYEKSDYQHVTTVNRSTGTYIVDCSGWGNVLLRTASCAAYADLVASANNTRGTTFTASCDLGAGQIEHGPYAVDWAHMLSSIPPGTPNAHWSRLTSVATLTPGDVITYALGPNATDTGHVMFCAGHPTQTSPTEWTVPIADSTASEHGPTDTRHNNPKNINGTGIGTSSLTLITDTNGTPTPQFRWYPTDPNIDTVPAPVLLGHLN